MDAERTSCASIGIVRSRFKTIRSSEPHLGNTACGEQRIVGSHGIHSDKDCVTTSPEIVDNPAAGLIADPKAATSNPSNLSRG